MTEKNNADFSGRKIFFLYPSVMIQNNIVEGLAQNEFEVYSLNDENKLKKLLKKYPNSIVFANISEGMLGNEWDNWIESIMTDSETAGVDIGIIAYGENANMRQKYTEQMGIRCGYTVMKPDYTVVVRQLISILNMANAKGRRKYIRVLIEKETDITASLPINGNITCGNIKDISTAGFSCLLPNDPELVRNSHFNNIQIRLETQTIKAQGMFFCSRMQGTEKIYVFLFTKSASPELQTGIHKFIRCLLQSKIENELGE